MTAVNLNRAIRGPVTAVPVVAGKGVRLVADTVNNRFVVEADETVLWEGSSPASTVTLSENAENFEYLDLHMKGQTTSQKPTVIRVVANNANTGVQINWSLGVNAWYLNCQKITISGTSVTVNSAHALFGNSFTGTTINHAENSDLIMKTIVKVVGVNRIASN